MAISCDTCERLWLIRNSLSLFEIQSLESKPCPLCGAYTLGCHEAEESSADEALKISPWQTARV